MLNCDLGVVGGVSVGASLGVEIGPTMHVVYPLGRGRGEGLAGGGLWPGLE